MSYSARVIAGLKSRGECIQLCYGHGNPPAGLHCSRKVVPGTELCRIHQPDYVRPNQPLSLSKQLLEAKALLHVRAVRIAFLEGVIKKFGQHFPGCPLSGSQRHFGYAGGMCNCGFSKWDTDKGDGA